MSTFSKMDAWRSAEMELRSAQAEFRRVHLQKRGRDWDGACIDDLHVRLHEARCAALHALHDVLEDARQTMSGGLWTMWHRKVLDLERRIHDCSRSVANLECCLGVATAAGGDGITEDEALRSEQHLLGLYTFELTLLLERPQHAARLGCGNDGSSAATASRERAAR